MRKIIAAAIVCLLPSAALAGSSPNWVSGYVPTAAQWNAEFASKQDDLGYVPLNKAGDSMIGHLGLVASTTSGSGLTMNVGVAPTAPNNGDVWMTNAGLYYRDNGVTIGPLFGTGSAAALTSVSDTNITATLSGTPATALLQPVAITLGWSGTLAAGRLNANVVQAITNDTNVTGSIATQNLTLGWAGTLAVTRGGTGASTKSAAASNILPTPANAGDVVYWNGTAWVTVAGNTVGTKVLQETSTGVPSWVAAGTGTVTSVTCGTGLSGGTFTTSGTCATSLSTLTNSIAASVSLNNTASYFDGPTVAQGTSGTWLATGKVTVSSPTADGIVCKLWDGTTVIDVGVVNLVAGSNAPIALSGVLASPAANIKISCRDTNTTSGSIVNTADAIVKASTLTVIRIQ